MLPKKVIKKILDDGFYFEDNFDSEKNDLIITQKLREWFNEELGLKKIDSSFVDFYSFVISPLGKGGQLFDLEEILENYHTPHPLYAQYPQIGKRYLQISSPEGEHSYFYDKETDAVYSVDWSQLDDLNAGKLKPMFNSFYDFLEWYYDEEEDDT